VTRVVIVGAGLLGAALADRLAARGAEVTIMERGRPGGGTSATSFAWLNAEDKAPAGYFALNAAGISAHRALAESLGGDWYHLRGHLVIGRGPAAAAVHDRIERHRALDYPVQALGRAAVAALEPDLDLGAEREFTAAHFPDEGWIDPPAVIGRLVCRARATGARLLHDSEVVDIELRGGRVSGIVTRTGDRLTADAVVLAAGPSTGRLAALAGATLPMAPTPGLLATTAAVAQTVSGIVQTEAVVLRPDGGSRLLLASRELDAKLDPAIREIGTDAAAPQALLERARRLIPALGDIGLETARIGVRSVAVDGLPVTGFAPGLDGLYLLVTHSGATLAPLLGELVAAELLGDPCAQLEPYRPARFAA
jgi:glycine/D-amino acid oxidase-like deaminating enzyme